MKKAQTDKCIICGTLVGSGHCCDRCRSAVVEDLLIRIKYRVKEHPTEPLPVPLINELDRTMIYSLKEWKTRLAKEAEAKLEQERRALAEHEALIAGMKASLEKETQT